MRRRSLAVMLLAGLSGCGCPAIMVTDTAVFRNAHYHQPTDTPEKLDYDRMGQVVSGIAGVILDLTRGPRPSDDADANRDDDRRMPP